MVLKVERLARASKTYEQIKAETGLSLGTISKIVNAAIEREKGESSATEARPAIAVPPFGATPVVPQGVQPDAPAPQNGEV